MPQLDPVLDALVEMLLRMCDQYDTQTANFILTATLNYINSTCLEPEIETKTLTRGAVRFPWFFRDRTGLSLAFAHMLFPKSQGICLADYVQVLEDMNFWICGVNDILSCVDLFTPSLSMLNVATPLGSIKKNSQARKAIISIIDLMLRKRPHRKF